ncbi:MAG: hypothetical protein ACRDF0_07200, partial [Candidatus Limnocylindria bacterium]
MMAARAAMPTDVRSVAAFLAAALRDEDAIVGSVLPAPIAAGAVARWDRMLPGIFGLPSRLRVYVEHHAARLRAAALVYEARRPEWVVLVLAARPGPDGADGAFRLLSHVCAAAAQRGMQRVFATVPDVAAGTSAIVRSRERETFFQAGFYSYTRETWYLAADVPLRAPARRLEGRYARGRDAHHLFRFYAMTTPHAVQRAEQLTVEDFDVGRRAGAFDPPHLVGGNPLAMRRQALMIVADDLRPRAFAVAFRGSERHAHVCKVRTADGDVDLAREL